MSGEYGTGYGTDGTEYDGTDGYADDTATAGATIEDIQTFDYDGNGVIDTIGGFVDGVGTIALVDVDENGSADYAEIDVNDDGIADATITSNGDGSYYITMDTDGDGTFETELTATVADLESQWPELAAVLTDGTLFGGADPATDPGTTDPATGPGTTPTTDASGLTPTDSNGDGVADAAWGMVQNVGDITVLDSDQNGAVDYAEIDTDGNGVVDVSIQAMPDGTYTMLFDTDYDGTLETELVVSIEDIQAEWPELAGLLATGAVFAPATSTTDPYADPYSDPYGDPTTTTPADPGTTAPTDPYADPSTTVPTDPSTDPATTDPYGRDPYADPTTDPSTDPAVVDGAIIGDPGQYEDEWFYQSFNGACVPSAVAQVYEEYTGQDITEAEFVELANEVGGWVVGPDGLPGLSAESAVEMLEAAGIPADLMMTDMDGLSDAIADGRAVIVAVDSSDIWYGSDGDDVADHAVVVSAIDTEAGLVYLSDTGDPDGNVSAVPIATFEEAWGASGNTMIVCDQSGADYRAENGIAEPAATDDSMGAVRSGTAGEAAEARPWALLPVTLPASTLVQAG